MKRIIIVSLCISLTCACSSHRHRTPQYEFEPITLNYETTDGFHVKPAAKEEKTTVAKNPKRIDKPKSKKVSSAKPAKEPKERSAFSKAMEPVVIILLLPVIFIYVWAANMGLVDC